MEKEFSTCDLPMAAYLLLNGLVFLRTESAGDRKALFVFLDDPSRIELMRDFWNRNGRVDPLKYLQAIRSLKGAAEPLTR